MFGTGWVGPSTPIVKIPIPQYEDKTGVYMLFAFDIEDTQIHGPFATIGECISAFASCDCDRANIDQISGLNRHTVMSYESRKINRKWHIGWYTGELSEWWK